MNNSTNTAISIALFNKLKKSIDDELATIKKMPGPKGSPGNLGPKGDQGIAGVTGKKGDTGPIGPKGEKGDAGLTGETGTIGPKGEKGEKGDAGLTGETGTIGPKGATGPKGEKGEKGTLGATGPKGEKGIPGPNGEKGTPGAAGATGPKGTPGATGPKGEKGEKGTPGAAGATGPKGEKGEKGIPGATGPKGEKGIPGATGPKGENADPIDIAPHIQKIESNFNKYRETINRQLSTIGGGGSTKILRMDDVKHVEYKEVLDDSILIYDKENRKFQTESLIAALERSGYQTGGGGFASNIVEGVGISVGEGSSSTISIKNTAVAPDTYGSRFQIPKITVDQQGRVTNAINVPIPAGKDLYVIDQIPLSGFQDEILFETYDIEYIVSYVVRDQTNKIVAIDAIIESDKIIFDANVDLSNFNIEISYLGTQFEVTQVKTFNLSGTSYTVDFTINNIETLINYYILDPQGNVVDLVSSINSNELTLESNIELINHVLYVVSQ